MGRLELRAKCRSLLLPPPQLFLELRHLRRRRRRPLHRLPLRRPRRMPRRLHRRLLPSLRLPLPRAQPTFERPLLLLQPLAALHHSAELRAVRRARPQPRYLRLEMRHLGLLRVLCKGDGVDHLPRHAGVVQRRQRLFQVARLGTDARDHERARRAAKAIHEQRGELGLAVGHVLLLLAQRGEHPAQREQ